MYHYRKTRRNYVTLNASDSVKPECTICDKGMLARVTKENSTMMIIPNRVSYDIFEGIRVLDHLMVVPKRHIEEIGKFGDQEKLDFMAMIGEFESQGYSVYARGLNSVMRSVKHQHTHLIKLDNKKAKAVVYIAKPYVCINI